MKYTKEQYEEDANNVNKQNDALMAQHFVLGIFTGVATVQGIILLNANKLNLEGIAICAILSIIGAAIMWKAISYELSKIKTSVKYFSSLKRLCEWKINKLEEEWVE